MSLLTMVTIIQTIGVVVGLATIVVLNMQESSYYQKILSLTSICSFIGLVAYLFELLSDNAKEALLAAKFGYIGKSYAMVLFLLFITKYCDFHLPDFIKKGLLVFSTVMLIIILSNDYHNLYYTNVSFVSDANIPHLVLSKGIVYYIFMAVILMVMLTYETVAFSSLIKRKGRERRRLMLLCLACIVPAFGLILNFLPVMKGFDPTPAGIMGSCLIITYTVLRYGLLDAMQLAREDVIDLAQEGVIVVGKGYNYIYSNKKAETILPELGSDGDRKKLLQELFAGVDEDNLEKRIYEKDDVIYELRYSVLGGKNQDNVQSISGYMLWIFDKTKDYRYTKELERLRIEAEKANKEKSMFLAKMSHEIRTPMNGIMGFADLALQNELDTETKEYVEYIKNSADSLLGIINDVLDISKIESGKMEIIEVEYSPLKMFRDISVVIETQSEAKGLVFKLEFDDAIPSVLYGDSLRFREVLINVLGNAVKYTQKGQISFSIRVKQRTEEALVFEIHVKDTGVGIKPEKLESIFKTFEQVDNVANYHVEGTGLGLSIAKQLTELMGGSLTVESEYGKGSDFCIILPQKLLRINIEENEEGVDAGQAYKMYAEGVKALVVDDNDINLKVAKGLLEKYKITVDLADSGELCITKSDLDKYDVILMDHMMPDMDGVETFEKLRQSSKYNSTTPVLLVTANAVMQIRQELMSKGFDGYVSKPIDTKVLEKELLKVLPSDKVNIIMENEMENTTSSAQFFDNMDFKLALSKVGVDMDEGVKYCGDVEYYKEILKISVESYRDRYDKIKSSYDAKDYKNYTILVHSLKSGAANIGAIELSELSRTLEFAGKEENIALIEEKTDDLLLMYTEVIEGIKAQLEKDEDIQEPSEAFATESIPVSTGVWEENLFRLKFLLDELEADEAIRMADKLYKYDVSDAAKKLLEELIKHLDEFDIEGAKVRLNSLMSTDI